MALTIRVGIVLRSLDEYFVLPEYPLVHHQHVLPPMYNAGTQYSTRQTKSNRMEILHYPSKKKDAGQKCLVVPRPRNNPMVNTISHGNHGNMPRAQQMMPTHRHLLFDHPSDGDPWE